jgi:uncharacterized membrane protein YqiK
MTLYWIDYLYILRKKSKQMQYTMIQFLFRPIISVLLFIILIIPVSASVIKNQPQNIIVNLSDTTSSVLLILYRSDSDNRTIWELLTEQNSSYPRKYCLFEYRIHL